MPDRQVLGKFNPKVLEAVAKGTAGPTTVGTKDAGAKGVNGGMVAGILIAVLVLLSLPLIGFFLKKQKASYTPRGVICPPPRMPALLVACLDVHTHPLVWVLRHAASDNITEQETHPTTAL